ncbi:MAG TPA: UDP-N-acetylmuramoyl-L-alanine--D-glutamate ligase [Phycisphaerales bacterium]|nr:UDP-N-acetylmuramoyl-L-alanine--D-glutamate ligase [Phycisphaerales bacterium]
MRSLDNARVTVMGLGRFGGGLGVTQWLASRGAQVLVTDMKPAETFTEELAALAPLIRSGQVTLRLGEHNVSDFTTCDLVVANAAVPTPWNNRFLRAAQAARIEVTTEISLLVANLPRETRENRTIAITGSVGKSTTTAMIAHALSACNIDVKVGGNLGGSLLTDLATITSDTWLVLELSSAQLHWIETTTPFSPRVAVVTAFVENHLDWHGDLAHYRESKRHILRHQRAGDTAIIARELDDWLPSVQPGVRVIRPQVSDISGTMTLPGEHNRANAAAALAACLSAIPTLDANRVRDALRTYKGLEHRLEFVREVAGVRYFNDSKSTTPGATLTALAAIATSTPLQRVHLIAGGYDKKVSLRDLGELAHQVAGVYAIGATAPIIVQESAGKAKDCGDLARAFVEVKQRVKPGDVVLLSPGCASWGQFDNFEQRGEQFKQLVEGVE